MYIVTIMYRRSRKNMRTRRKRKMTRRSRRLPMSRITNNGLRFFKLRYSNSLSSDGVSVMSHYIDIWNMTTVFDGAGTVQDWTNLTALFDSYRVNAVKIKFIPLLPNDLSTGTPPIGFSPLYIGTDYDALTSAGIPSSAGAAIQYETMQVKNLFRPWSYYVKIPKYTRSTYIAGYQDMAASVTNGLIWMYGTSFYPSTSYGTVIITWYVSCKNRR